MKKINVVTVGLAISLFAFITCKPDRIDPPTPLPPPPAPANKPPVAKAGKDTSINLAACGLTANFRLDGSASFDPDNSTIVYLWKFLTSQFNANFSDATSARPEVFNLKIGQYYIELTVKDTGGLFAKDTIIVDVIGSTPKGYDLDVTMSGIFRFDNNYEDCYYCYDPCCYYDISSVDNATGTFSPIGNLHFYIYELADTAAASNPNHTHFGLYTNNNNVSVYGTSSINFKKLFQDGGGSFSGTFTLTGGSALQCDPDIFKNLAPLTVTGTLNTTNIITLNIKGKIYL